MGTAAPARRASPVSRFGPGDVAAQDLISWKTGLYGESPSPCLSPRRVRLGPATTAGTPDKTVGQYTSVATIHGPLKRHGLEERGVGIINIEATPARGA
ncbi:hypothetical protein DL765_003622 [Monosporascus sp. GIB2]|nr:hypothetical protein DL765_003622 [Monosporascus sp. GIB2]